jgi:hypothetical protein
VANIPEAVKAWLASLTAADPEETPEPVGVGEDPTTEPDAPAGDSDVTPDPAVSPDAPADAPGEEAPNAASESEPAGGTETLPDPTTGLSDAERDAMNALAAENEALRSENADLRNRIAELGGDAALGIVEEVVEPPAEDPAEEYDADADIAEQHAELARLRGA